MKFTDSHCHLDFSELTDHHTDILLACANKNIHQIIVPSISPDNWQQVLSLSKLHTQPKTFACLGIHPWFLNDLTYNCLDELTVISTNNKNHIIAIGETGIDGKIAEEQGNLSKQIDFFEHQLILAKKLNKPVIIHHYKAHQHIIPLLKKHHISNGVIHGFSGSFQQATNYIDLGFKLGIGGTITYPRAIKTIKTVSKLPLDSILLETDAPSMPLFGFQGEVNSPLKILDVFERLCEIRNDPPENIALAIESNIKKTFSI